MIPDNNIKVKIDGRSHEFMECHDWCVENIGHRQIDWDRELSTRGTFTWDYFFVEEKNALMFLLRWS